MHNHVFIPMGALAILFTLHSTASLAEPKIGSAAVVKNRVQGVVDGKAESLSNGSEVYTNEVVRTGSFSVTDLVFIDLTKLSIGPVSEVRLDKFVYDPAGSSGRVVIQATRGAFRFVTGSQDKKVYEIKTPYGTLGVRG
jgi:hypothetical protein